MNGQLVLLRAERWIKRRSRFVTVAVSLAVLVAVGVLDYVTGVEVVVNFLYLVPVYIVTWRLGRTPGLLMALGGAAVCAGVDWMGRPGLAPWVASWNVVGDFGVFALFAIAVFRISIDLAAQRRLNAELQSALSQVKTLSGLLPICAWCKKIRDQSGQWRRLEEYISSHAEVDFTHSICPECRDKFHHT